MATHWRNQYALALVLLLILFFCSLLLINSRHQARLLLAQEDRNTALLSQLEAEWFELEAKRSLLAQPARIDSEAREKRNMRNLAINSPFLYVWPPTDKP